MQCEKGNDPDFLGNPIWSGGQFFQNLNNCFGKESFGRGYFYIAGPLIYSCKNKIKLIIYYFVIQQIVVLKKDSSLLLQNIVPVYRLVRSSDRCFDFYNCVFYKQLSFVFFNFHHSPVS